jgi:phenylalanyl-tRNA synthetase beta subunit
VLARFKIKRARPVYLELDHDALLAPREVRPFVEPPREPPVERSLALTLPPHVRAGDVAAALRDAAPDWLADVAIVDRYDHVEDGVAVSTITYALSWSLEDVARTADELNGATEALTAAVLARFADAGVRQRGA